MAKTPLVLRYGAHEYRTVVQGDGTVLVDGTAVSAARAADGTVRVGQDPPRAAWTAIAGDVRWVFLDGCVYRFDVVREGRRARTAGHHGSLAAPMPATVVRIQTAAGDTVTRGQTLIVLEAMKMELPVHAPADGKIAAVLCREGDLVQPGTPLIELEDAPGS